MPTRAKAPIGVKRLHRPCGPCRHQHECSTTREECTYWTDYDNDPWLRLTVKEKLIGLAMVVAFAAAFTYLALESLA